MMEVFLMIQVRESIPRAYEEHPSTQNNSIKFKNVLTKNGFC